MQYFNIFIYIGRDISEDGELIIIGNNTWILWIPFDFQDQTASEIFLITNSVGWIEHLFFK